jgi:hypothetical protein
MRHGRARPWRDSRSCVPRVSPQKTPLSFLLLNAGFIGAPYGTQDDVRHGAKRCEGVSLCG